MKNGESITVFVKALRRIRGLGCSRFTSGACRFEKHLYPTAKYGADRWCLQCIAADALEKTGRARKVKR